MITTEYIWEGIDVAEQLIKGVSETTHLSEVLMELKQKNIIPLKIKKKYSWNFLRPTKIAAKNITTFFRELAILINANIPLVSALTMIARNSQNVGLKNILISVKEEIEKGQSFTAALKKHPQTFNPICCNLINVGEKSGTLDLILNHLALHAEKTQLQKRRLIKALFYPAIVLIVATLVTVVLLVFVVPQFKMMFANFGASLPLYTQGIIEIAELIKADGLIILGCIIGGVLTVKYAQKHSRTVAKKIDALLIALPVVGELIKKHHIAQVIRTTGLAFKSGLPLLEALELTINTVGNLIYQEEISRVIREVSQGKTLHLALSEKKLFPLRVIQFVTIGEESGTLDDMLLRITEHYEEEIKNITENISNLLEPLITIVLGIIIGGLVIGMYLPIFKLGKII